LVRRTKQKEAIISVLRGTTSHPDAEWVYEKVKRQIPGVSLGTIYRNLRILKETGAIQEIDTSGEEAHFDGNPEPHYHFRCDRCGRIFDLDETVDKEIEERVESKTGFKVTHHHLEVGGICSGCLEGIKQLPPKK
jgi:Fur family transcriptional regulator, peroxide stress response regulator